MKEKKEWDAVKAKVKHWFDNLGYFRQSLAKSGESKPIPTLFLWVCLLVPVGLCVVTIENWPERETVQQATSPSAPAPTKPWGASTLDLTPISERTLVADTVVSQAVSSTSNSRSQLRDTSQKVEAQMDSMFSDGWDDMNRQLAQSKISSATDLREQRGMYVVRLYLPNPNTSGVATTILNGALQITTPPAPSPSSINTNPPPSKQVIQLPPSIDADKMKTDRKKDVVIVTVPKSNPASPVRPTSPRSRAMPDQIVTDWDGRLVQEMGRLKGRMDDAFRDGSGNLANSTDISSLASAIKVDDQPEKYVVHFFLPDRDTKDVEVKFKDGELDLIAQDKQLAEANAGDTQTIEGSKYEQTVALSEPVKDNEMKVVRKGFIVTVTLPKQ